MVRPRRALRPALRIRVARVAVPALAAGALATGVTGALWPDSISAVPAPINTPAAAVGERTERTERPSRTQAEPRPARGSAGEAARTKDRDHAASAAKAKQAERAAKAKQAQEKKRAEGKKEAEAEQEAEAKKQAAAERRADEKAEAEAEATKEAAAQPRAEADEADQAEPAEVIGRRYTTTAVNIRSQPDADSSSVTVLEPAAKVAVTDIVRAGWRQVRHDGSARWVKNSYLARSKPEADDTEETDGGGLSSAPCADGSGMESGLTSDAIAVHRALCARFPQVSSYGGRRADSGNHGSGRAIDAMIGDSSVGWEIARYARSNAKRLGVSEVIYAQKIWTVQRGGDGWRSMSDRGSVSANHYDHVHVSVYGNAATG